MNILYLTIHVICNAHKFTVIIEIFQSFKFYHHVFG